MRPEVDGLADDALLHVDVDRHPEGEPVVSSSFHAVVGSTHGVFRPESYPGSGATFLAGLASLAPRASLSPPRPRDRSARPLPAPESPRSTNPEQGVRPFSGDPSREPCVELGVVVDDVGDSDLEGSGRGARGNAPKRIRTARSSKKAPHRSESSSPTTPVSHAALNRSPASSRYARIPFSRIRRPSGVGTPEEADNESALSYGARREIGGPTSATESLCGPHADPKKLGAARVSR